LRVEQEEDKSVNEVEGRNEEDEQESDGRK
jgi:hypothetical protein